ncbi:hypothetical protein ACIO1C_16385 [Streptomyces sp. NPDC087420]|uniref:hypothetical protein n=1 Tax=Streptomyces sp. NPDC087420 TaxID=3365785 RepID=UPI003836780E
MSVEDDGTHGYALPEPLRTGNDAYALRTGFSTDAEWLRFLKRNEAAPVGEARVSIVLKGLRSTVRVTDMRVHMTDTDPVLKGTAIRPYTQGDVASVPVLVDLDEPRPRIRGKGGAPYFQGYSIDLAKDERVSVELRCKGDKAHYEFSLGIDYLDDDGKHTLYLGRSGRTAEKPAEIKTSDTFRVTGEARSYSTVYEGNNMGRGYHPVR